MDKETVLTDQIAGLKVTLEETRKERDVLIKVQGMNTEAIKLQNEAQAVKNEIPGLKNQLQEEVSKKNSLLEGSILKAQETMNGLLPSGKAEFVFPEEGGIIIKWIRDDGKNVPYAGLSGGEKVGFDVALAGAMKANVILVEAAEMDTPSLLKALDAYEKAGDDLQIIVSTCHSPGVIPASWVAVQL